jgi:hypothetical protein
MEIGTLLLNERNNGESGDGAIPEGDPGTTIAQQKIAAGQ